MIRTNFFVVLFAAFCLTVLVAPVTAQEYYVANDGNDANPGSIDAPFRTIQHAADIAAAGDRVNIRGGIYNEHVRITNGGNPGASITYSAYPGEVPVIDGTGVAESQNGIVLIASNIKLIGLEVRNWDENGIWVENSGFLEITDCNVHHVGYGIGLSDGTHDFVLNRVEMHHFDYYGFDASPAGGGDCYNGELNDCIAHSARIPELGNEVDGFALSHEGDQHDFSLNRCEAYNVGDGFVFGGRDVDVNRCLAHHSEVGFKVWGDSIQITNCLAYENVLSNLELDWDEVPGTTTVLNSNFINPGDFNIWIENSGDSLHLFNSIIAGSENLGLVFEQRNPGNYEGDYNIFHDDDTEAAIDVGYEDEFSLDQIQSGEWTAYSGQDAHSIVVDSLGDLFINAEGYDFRLVEESPAIDAGREVGAPAEDFRGNPRSGRVDIGAFEKGGVPSTGSTPSATTGRGGDEPSPTEAAIPIGVSLIALCIAGVTILKRNN